MGFQKNTFANLPNLLSHKLSIDMDKSFIDLGHWGLVIIT